MRENRHAPLSPPTLLRLHACLIAYVDEKENENQSPRAQMKKDESGLKPTARKTRIIEEAIVSKFRVSAKI